MAITVTCDGCNEIIDDGAVEYGLYIKKQYCKNCAIIYKEFLERRDNELSLKAFEVEAWLDENRKVLREKLKGLPDE